jgi:hypothetical protein
MYTADMHIQFSTMSMVFPETVLQQQIGEPHIMVPTLKKKKDDQQLLYLYIVFLTSNMCLNSIQSCYKNYFGVNAHYHSKNIKKC